MIEVTIFPGRRGDCILVSYGNEAAPKHILVDGGFKGTYDDIKPVLASLQGSFQILMLSHVDLDHVRGILAYLADEDRPMEFADIWFNGFDHLNDETIETFGAQHGELMTDHIMQQALPWNAAFGGKSIEVARDPVVLDDETTITILSPDRRALEDLIDDWVSECKKHGLIPGVDAVEPAPPSGLEVMGAIDIDKLAASDFDQDDSKPNRTTIAFLLEHAGKRLVMTGDAHPDRLVESLAPLAGPNGKVALDALLVPHHGSRNNLNMELVELVDCKRFLFSTSGAVNRHPHAETVARVIKAGNSPEIVFNYSERAAPWEDRKLIEDHGYTVTKPRAGEDGTVVVPL